MSLFVENLFNSFRLAFPFNFIEKILVRLSDAELVLFLRKNIPLVLTVVVCLDVEVGEPFSRITFLIQIKFHILLLLRQKAC
jgi:hypothetical protein